MYASSVDLGLNLTNVQVLKPACVAALKRIFKLCDTNKDNILDPSELNEFQVSSVHICVSSTAQDSAAEMF
jgi:hypothetical protein